MSDDHNAIVIMPWFSKVSLAEPRTSGAGQQFENGDVIVTLLPVNERFPWVTPARSAAFACFLGVLSLFSVRKERGVEMVNCV